MPLRVALVFLGTLLDSTDQEQSLSEQVSLESAVCGENQACRNSVSDGLDSVDPADPRIKPKGHKHRSSQPTITQLVNTKYNEFVCNY